MLDLRALIGIVGLLALLFMAGLKRRAFLLVPRLDIGTLLDQPRIQLSVWRRRGRLIGARRNWRRSSLRDSSADWTQTASQSAPVAAFAVPASRTRGEPDEARRLSAPEWRSAQLWT